MGVAFRKAFRAPVAVDNWESLREEAQRIHMSLETLSKERLPTRRRELTERRQRFIILKSQWFRIYSLLHNLTKHTNSNENEYTSLTSDIQYQWLIAIKNKMDYLIEQSLIPPLSSIPEHDEYTT